MKYNRTNEATALLSQIEAWCRATATPETSVGRVLFFHPGFVGLLRLRLTVSEDKERIVREFMAEHPEGYHGPLPLTHANGTRPVRRPQNRTSKRFSRALVIAETNRAELAALPRVDRDPCPRCGARGDLDCGHSHAPLRMVL